MTATARNLVAKNGTAVHAPAPEGTTRNSVLCSNMRRASGYWTIEAQFSPVDAPITCIDCCRILGIEAPKVLPGAKRAKPALDAFEVGQRFCYSDLFNEGTDRRYGLITKLTTSWVTFVPENGPVGKSGTPQTMAVSRDKARRLNP